MDNLINFIMGGAQELTPEVLVRYMCFVLILSCISSIASALLDVGKMR